MLSLHDIERIIKELDIRIAILTVPPDFAIEIC